MKILKRVLSVFLRIGISVVLLVFLFRQVDAKSMFALIKNADFTLLLAAFFTFFFNYLFCILRWEMLLSASGIKLPFKRVLISFAGGSFFNLFLPSTIGGDVIRSIDLAAHTKKPKQILATVLLDRLSGYIGLVLLALLALSIGWGIVRDTSVLLAVFIITLILTVILLALFNKFIYKKINNFIGSAGAGKFRKALGSLHEELHIFRGHRQVIIKNLFISLLVQLTAPLVFYFIALSLGVKINIIYFFIFSPLIGAITLLPISIGGLGLRDASTIFFFAKAGLNKDLAFAMSLLSFLFIVIYGAVGGIIYVLTVHHRKAN